MNNGKRNGKPPEHKGLVQATVHEIFIDQMEYCCLKKYSRLLFLPAPDWRQWFADNEFLHITSTALLLHQWT